MEDQAPQSTIITVMEKIFENKLNAMIEDQNEKHDQIIKMLQKQGSNIRNKRQNSSSMYIASSHTSASPQPPTPYNLGGTPY